MMLIVRREGRKLQRYVHLGTGNYHTGTARLYTDIGLMTANPEIGEDAPHVPAAFRSGALVQLSWLLQSPFTLHAALLAKTARETALAREGWPARIIAKMNALNEPQVMRALLEASQAGVQIDLIVRGACSLRPGVPGFSDNIRASIVGRFLRTQPATGSATTASRKSTVPAPTGWSATSLRRIETCFRSWTRRWRNASTMRNWPTTWPTTPGLAIEQRRQLRTHPTRRGPDAVFGPERTAGHAMPMTSTSLRDGELLAAIDLGSNSFHMVVARAVLGQLRIIDRLRETVRMASGLNAKGDLDPAARERALGCLSRFGERIHNIPPHRVRAIATNTVRQLRNPQAFLIPAETALGHGIEVVSGREEARLIYLGVAHGMPPRKRAGWSSTSAVVRPNSSSAAVSSHWSAKASRWAASPRPGVSFPMAA